MSDASFVFAHVSFAMMYYRISGRLKKRGQDETDRASSAARLSVNSKEQNKAIMSRKHMIQNRLLIAVNVGLSLVSTVFELVLNQYFFREP